MLPFPLFLIDLLPSEFVLSVRVDEGTLFCRSGFCVLLRRKKGGSFFSVISCCYFSISLRYRGGGSSAIGAAGGSAAGLASLPPNLHKCLLLAHPAPPRLLPTPACSLRSIRSHCYYAGRYDMNNTTRHRRTRSGRHYNIGLPDDLYCDVFV